MWLYSPVDLTNVNMIEKLVFCVCVKLICIVYGVMS